MIQFIIRVILFGAVVSVVLVTACQDPYWYPSAEVTVGDHYEYTDGTGTKLATTIVIHNTSKTSITTSTITLQVKTTKRTYLQTAQSALKIIPDGTAALTVSIPYLEADEQVLPDSIRIYSSFFD